jgi:DNA-binding SARP family transcriptional activator
MDFRILGPLEVRDDDRRIDVGGPGQRSLLALLLLHANRTISCSQLVDWFWGRDPPRTFANVLQVRVSRLRRALGDVGARGGARQPLVTRPAGYLLELAGEELDAVRFERLIDQGRQALLADQIEQAAADLRAALALWRGPALADVPSNPLIDAEALRLEENRVAALEARIEADFACGRHRELVGELEGLIALHPLREVFHGQLMRALYLSGRQAEALHTYRAARTVLIKELGIEPSDELRRLERAVLSGDPSLQYRPTPPVRAREQGYPPVLVPCQLPPDIDDFTGHEDAAAQVQQLLTREHSTAIVISAITGMAGVGKTALGVHVAHRLRWRFPGGQLYADLRGAEAQPLDPAAVLAGFMGALGVAGPAVPGRLEDRTRLFRTQLAGRRVLVVLDNAASEAQVRPLLPSSRGCAVLLTSRARLGGLEAAHPLTLDLFEADRAVELLAKLAGPARVAAEPEAAMEVVRLCGLLPLAVRIAGARLAARPHWRLARLAARLRDGRRLDELRIGDLDVRASVARSYQHCSTDERRLFRLLGLLVPSGFSAASAASLLGVEVADANNLLERLVDAQLVEVAGEDRAGHLRYRLHALLRIFATERLGDEAPAQLRTVLAAWR